MLNSAFSALSGLLLTFSAKTFNALLGISNTIVLPIIGINLLIFSLVVYYVAVKQLKTSSLVNLITGLDVLWVVGSAFLIFLQLFSLTTIGYVIIGAVAIWIGYLAFMQFKYNEG